MTEGMTLSNAIKKAEKITGQKAKVSGQMYFFNYKGYVVSFAQNGRYDESTNFYTRKSDLQDDHQSDYFAGTFHDNLTQAFKFIERR